MPMLRWASRQPQTGPFKKLPADDAAFAFLKAATGFGVTADPQRQAMLRLELTQLASVSPRRGKLCQTLVLAEISDRQRRLFFEALLDEGKASQPLRRYLEGQLGRAASVPRPHPRSLGRPPKKHPRLTGTQLPRRILSRPPARRRLQIFAIDPGASNRLETAFINRAVVDMPWETTPTNSNVLQPGPVGDYVEVVDVDPASGAAYEPVDLNDPFLLAQDGLTPSEGNPKFHQQMVYAVIMRTIETFDSALGRRALWAPKRIETSVQDPNTSKPVRHYQEIYVPRLRIYPHALREANAYYSPDKIALLLGYFPSRFPGPAETPLAVWFLHVCRTISSLMNPLTRCSMGFTIDIKKRPTVTSWRSMRHLPILSPSFSISSCPNCCDLSWPALAAIWQSGN